MAYASLYLPVATGDFSGAASVFHDLPCSTIILDPKGCTMDYLEVEDPRLPETFNRVRSAQLDDIDVTIGDCNRIRKIAREFIENDHLEFLVVIGSTVSSIIGMDVDLLADDLEDEFGLPVIGVDTDGFTTYAQGIHTATRALLERFGEEGEPDDTVNILGFNPIDFRSYADLTNMCRAIERCGKRVGTCLAAGMKMDGVRRAPQASMNLVVSTAGWETALWMKRRYGIPFAVHCPITADDSLLDAALGGYSLLAPSTHSSKRVLMVADAVIGASLKRWMQEQGYQGSIELASFFKTASAFPNVTYLQGDLELLELLDRERYDAIIGDPLLTRIPGIEAHRFAGLPQPALSSVICRRNMPTFAGNDPFFEQLLSL